MIQGNQQTIDLDAVNSARDRLKAKERDPRLVSDTAQWLYWASHKHHVGKFNKLIDILKVMKKRPLTWSEHSLLLDALAVGHTNITPYRVEWVFKYAPKRARQIAINHIDYNRLQPSVEEAVIACNPTDPSQGQAYSDLWRNFKVKPYLKNDNAFDWSLS
jgi:hypothetical protein